MEESSAYKLVSNLQLLTFSVQARAKIQTRDLLRLKQVCYNNTSEPPNNAAKCFIYTLFVANFLNDLHLQGTKFTILKINIPHSMCEIHN